MNIQYSKWNKNEMKILNNSLRNILDTKEPQLYFPIMSLFFYIHNTPNSHKFIDFKRNHYLREIIDFQNIKEYNSNILVKAKVDNKTLNRWKLDAMDKFMTECGDALKYTATVSQYFSIPELFALKEFMYKHDTKRMLQMAHQKFDETELEQWKHEDKWKKYCEVCQSKEELSLKISP